MEDILSLIEKIFPILIFVFWVIVSIIASARKNKNRVPAPTRKDSTQPQQQTVSPSERQTPSQTANRSVNDLKTKLESIFGELTFETNDKKTEEPHEMHYQETQPEKVPPEHVPYLARKKTKVSVPVSSSEIDIYSQEYISSDEKTTMRYPSIEELRKAVIWSEIIAPPVSLREE